MCSLLTQFSLHSLQLFSPLTSPSGRVDTLSHVCEVGLKNGVTVHQQGVVQEKKQSIVSISFSFPTFPPLVKHEDVHGSDA